MYILCSRVRSYRESNSTLYWVELMIIRVQVWFTYWRRIHVWDCGRVRNCFHDWSDVHACSRAEGPELGIGEFVFGTPS